jgi:hypothetical protein
MPSVVASRASSGADQRESGTPLSAGNWQASAVTWARCRGVKVQYGRRLHYPRGSQPGRPPIRHCTAIGQGAFDSE